MSSRRPPARGSVGDGDDLTLPGKPTSEVSIAVDDGGDSAGTHGGSRNGGDTLAERFEDWRRRYIPLPDEVIHQYLGEGEHVIHYDHPSFRAFLVKNLALVILLPIVGPVFVAFFRGGGLNWTSIAIFLFLDAIVVILALRRLGDRYTNYVITNVRLIRLKGIISRKLNSIPWTRMTGLGYEQGAMGRVLGYATIHIESANEESGLNKFSDINDPATFHQRLLDMISAKTGQSSSKPPPPPTRGERRSFFQKRKERRATLPRGARRPRSGPDVQEWAPVGEPARGARWSGTGVQSTPTAGSWASDTWSAARSAVRKGLQWPGSTEPETDDAGPGDADGGDGPPQGTPGRTETGQPPPPPSMRPPYRGRPEQGPPSTSERIVISTTSRPRPPKGRQLPSARPGGADDDTLEEELDEEE